MDSPYKYIAVERFQCHKILHVEIILNGITVDRDKIVVYRTVVRALLRGSTNPLHIIHLWMSLSCDNISHDSEYV